MATSPQAQPLPVALDDIRAAAGRIAGAVVRTPTLLSGTLSEATGANVWLKYENLQYTGAYKERGALNKLLLMDEGTRARGVIAASAGNHSQALAYHSRRLGVPATIVMPASTPSIKVSKTQGHGAEVILHGDLYDEAYAHALELADARGLTFVHPFDDMDVIAGQGTVALEMMEDAPEIDALIVPIGGGGLISGVASAAKGVKPGIEVIGAQAALYPSMYCKFSRQKLPCAGDTLAEGIAVKSPGLLTAGIINQVVDDIVLIEEEAIEEAVAHLLRAQKTVVEGAGAVGLAALLADPERFRGRNVGLILTGGNIDTRLLATVILRDLARSGRVARLRIQLQDRPGALFSVIRLFDRHQVNIIEIVHQRVFTAVPAKDAYVDVECEARDAGQIERLVADLGADGFQVRPVEIR
jgi:threonine dehydratase